MFYNMRGIFMQNKMRFDNAERPTIKAHERKERESGRERERVREVQTRQELAESHKIKT